MPSRRTPNRCTRCRGQLRSKKARPQPGIRIHSARGLCSTCYKQVDYLDYERITRSLDELLDDYVLLRSEGFDWRQCAQRLGMSYTAFERAMYRARAACDPRAARIGERWPVAA